MKTITQFVVETKVAVNIYEDNNTTTTTQQLAHSIHQFLTCDDCKSKEETWEFRDSDYPDKQDKEHDLVVTSQNKTARVTLMPKKMLLELASELLKYEYSFEIRA